MTTILFILVAVAMLAGIGWVIGWEVARSTVQRGTALPRIVAASEHHVQLRQALHAIGRPDTDTLLSEQIPSQRPFIQVDQRDGWLECRPSRWTPLSYALVRTPFDPEKSDQSWQAVASLIQAHDGEADTAAIRACGPPWAKDYDAARNLAFGQESPDLTAAHKRLQRAISHWPADRSEEKAVALANLAYLCLRLPEPGPTRLARLLEGYDAARQSLWLHYTGTDDIAVDGLRVLMRELQEAIARVRQGAGASAFEPACPQANSGGSASGHDDTRSIAL